MILSKRAVAVARDIDQHVATRQTSGHLRGLNPTIERRALTQQSAALGDSISSGYESLAIRISMGYVALMIRDFKGKFAEPILQGRMVPKGFPANLAKVARRKLIMLDAAAFLEALNSPPGNRLEALKGDLAGKHSIRINDQWRIVFRWTDAGPEDVEIIDYH
jgi:proteic killer suppression protein